MNTTAPVLVAKQSVNAVSTSVNRPQLVDKRKVAKGFDKAASVYTTLAEVQQRIADCGLSKLENANIQKVECLLDIGCGTAASFQRLGALASHVIGVDISANMLSNALFETAKCSGLDSRFSAANGDAESLPIQSSSIDVLYSSMALQWCESPQKVLYEVHRVLKQNGKALLCILTGESFNDLHKAWQQMNMPSRVNQFHSKDEWLDASAELNIERSTVVTSTHESFVSKHGTVIDMLSSIKRIGANTRCTDAASASAYISKKEIKSLQNYMKHQYGQQNAFPLCYEVLFLEIEK
jgi:malonyl-CoA O-methyltransferase